MQSLKRILLEKLSQKFTIDDDIIHYAYSTLGIEYNDLKEILKKDDNNDLYEIIITPRFTDRLDIERYIHPKGLQNNDLNCIIEFLCDNIDTLKILYDNDVIENSHKEYIKQYVYKLKLHKLNIEKKHLLDEKQLNNFFTARVLLRINNVKMRLDTFEDIVYKLIDLNNKQFHDAIKIIFQVCKDENVLFDNLEKYKITLQSYLWEIYEFNQNLKKYSMEVIMAVKKNVPNLSYEEINYKINLIDLIFYKCKNKLPMNFIKPLDIEF